MYVAHLLLRGRPLSTQDVWRGLDICPSGEKETFNVCHHTWWPRCRLLGSSPPPLMYSPPLIPEEGSPRPFRLLITRAKTLRGPNLSLSLCLPFSLSLQPAVSPLSGVREASFNSAREQDPPLSRGGNVHERERERESRDDFQLTPTFSSLDFMDVFCVLLREDPLSRSFQVVPPPPPPGEGGGIVDSFPGFQVSWEIRWVVGKVTRDWE